eukprot:Skav234637  [mRNA]  locus=scaffold1609:109609:118714:+ [translate_table: standard]
MDLAFVSLPQAAQAPRMESVAPHGQLYTPMAGGDSSNWAVSATLATVAAVTLFRAMRRRNWSPIQLGPKSGSCFYEMKFRAKPGAKYKYRYSTDVWEPEWGIVPTQKGRLIRYGQLIKKGEVVKPMADDDDDEDGWGVLGGADVGSGALLLDCDGTLAETERDGHRVAFNKAFEASVKAVVDTMLPDYASKLAIFAGDVPRHTRRGVREETRPSNLVKPDNGATEAIYNLAAKKLGVAPMRCVVVEDTAIGATAGKAAQMKARRHRHQ